MKELKQPEEMNESVQTSNMQRKEKYTTPCIEMMEVKVEKGYESSINCGV